MISSLFYTSDFYAKIMEISCSGTELYVRSFTELDKTGLTPLINRYFYNKTFAVVEDDYRVIQKLKKKTQFWNDPMTCADNMIKNNRVFCILTESLGIHMVEKFRKSNGKPRLRLMQRPFWVTWKGYAFNSGSPYIEKFDSILVKIVESGVLSQWLKLVKPPRIHLDDETEDEKSNIYYVIFMITGIYFMTLIVFIGEWLVFVIKKNI